MREFSLYPPQERAKPLQQEKHKESRWECVLHARVGSTAHCGAERASAGVQNLFRQGHMFPNKFKICLQFKEKHFNSAESLPSPSQNVQNAITKSTQNHSIRLLGAHCGAMLAKKSDLNCPSKGQATLKSDQETPQTVPSPSQMQPWWIQC